MEIILKRIPSPHVQIGSAVKIIEDYRLWGQFYKSGDNNLLNMQKLINDLIGSIDW
jgi:hypothetical protein